MLESVAVAVITGPVTELFGTEKLKLALQEVSLTAFVNPRKVWPTPLSQASFAKHSILNVF